MAKKSDAEPPARLALEILRAGGHPRHLLRRQPGTAQNLPDACVDLIYIDPPFNSNRNYEVFWGETREKRSFEDRHASTQAYIDFMRPRCVEWPASSKRPAASTTTATGTPPTTSKSCSTRFSGRIISRCEIIWQRTFGKGLAFTGFPNNHDTIFLLRRRWRDHLQPALQSLRPGQS